MIVKNYICPTVTETGSQRFREAGSISDQNYPVLCRALIKSITQFSNVISYHQPDLSTKRTVYALCL